MRLVLLGLLGAVACGRLGFGPSDASDGGGDAIIVDPDATTTAGARLQARYWVGSDGSYVFASFYDPMIGSRCAFQPDSSGGQRCFPSEVISDFSYAEASCVTPTLRVATGCASTPTLATVASGTHYQAVTLGAPTAGFVGAVSCSPAVDGAAYYLVGNPMPDTMFVGGAPTTVELADGLGRQELVADDGAHLNLGYAYNGTPCRVAETGANTAACIPQVATAFTGPRMYSDAACTIEVAGVNTPAPAYVTALDGEAPCAGTRYASTGATQTLTTLYVHNSAGGCSAITQTSATYAVITDVTASLPALSRVIDAGATRLHTWAWVSPGGARLEAGLYDTMLAAPCKPITDNSGVTTCAPVSFPFPVNHSNTMCNMSPPAAIALCDGDDSAAPVAINPLQEYATCNGLGTPLSTYTPSSVTAGYDSYAGACVPMNLTGATLYTTTTSPYQPSRAVQLTLQ
jgi:hypothetical protein